MSVPCCATFCATFMGRIASGQRCQTVYLHYFVQAGVRSQHFSMLLRSSTNCFAAASISMQHFHQTRFIRKTFCQRLIERCQTASMLPGLCQTLLCHLDFSSTGKKAFARRTGRWTQMKNSYSVSALIGVICGQVRIRLRLAALWSLWQNDFAVDSVFHNLSGHP